MGVFSPAGSKDVSVTTPSTTSSFTLYNLAIPLANTEYSFTFPSNTNRFTIKTRQASVLKIAYTLGGTVTNYLTISPGSVYSHTDVAVGGVTIYFASSVGSNILEVECGIN